MTDYGLGWRRSPEDGRDWSPSLLAQMVEAGVAVPVRWQVPRVLRQRGNRCVGYSFATLVSASTATAPAVPVTDDLGTTIYDLAKQIEGKPDPEGTEGAYLRSGAKACKQLGLISAYAMTRDYNAVEDWCSKHGPVALGIPWYEGMFQPDERGAVRPTGAYKGGHAIVFAANSQSPTDNGLVNTWGEDWGAGGWCYLANEHLYTLMRDGEACVAVKFVGVPYVDEWQWDEEAVLALNYLYVRGVMQGYPDRTFRPGEYLSYRQVALIAKRVDLDYPRGWLKDYLPCTRGDVRATFPDFIWDSERWEEPLTREQMARLTYRYLKERG